VSPEYSAGLNLPVDFVAQWRKTYGNFVIHNNPGWEAYSPTNNIMMNFNVTGGYPVRNVSILGLEGSQPEGNVETNNVLVNSDTWDAGRGARCRFWRSVAPNVPE